jgi:hypothetical protein
LFTRCDSTVLYILEQDYVRVAQLLAGIYKTIASGLRKPIPAFTKQIAPGLGLAEDPGGNESFSLHRCRLLADGIIRAFEQLKDSLESRIEIVTARFAEDGISLGKPFLGRNSEDGYLFEDIG